MYTDDIRRLFLCCVFFLFLYDRLRGEAWHAKHWAAEAARLGRDRDAALVDVARMNARADDLDAKGRGLVAVCELLTARIRELEERLRERDVWLEEKDAGLKEKDAGLEEKEARLQMIYGKSEERRVGQEGRSRWEAY